MEQLDYTAICFPYVFQKGEYIMNNEILEELATTLMQETVMILDEIIKMNDAPTYDFNEIQSLLERLNCDFYEMYLRVRVLRISEGDGSFDQVKIDEATFNNLGTSSDPKKEM